MQVIYGHSTSDIPAQTSDPRHNLDELRSKLPGFYPGFLNARQYKLPPTNWRSDHTEMRNTQTTDFEDEKTELVSSKRLRQIVFQDWQDGLDFFVNLSKLFGQIQEFFQQSNEPNVFLKASKQRQGDADFAVRFSKCLKKSVGINTLVKAWKQIQEVGFPNFEEVKDILAKAFKCFKKLVGKYVHAKPSKRFE